MRISDWSSDVCSSDLACRCCDGENGRRRQHADARENLPALSRWTAASFTLMDQSLSCAQSAADPRKLANLGRGHVCSSLHPIYRREPECAALLFLWLRRLGRKQHSACLDRKSTRLNSSH